MNILTQKLRKKWTRKYHGLVVTQKVSSAITAITAIYRQYIGNYANYQNWLTSRSIDDWLAISWQLVGD